MDMELKRILQHDAHELINDGAWCAIKTDLFDVYRGADDDLAIEFALIHNKSVDSWFFLSFILVDIDDYLFFVDFFIR